MSKQKSLVPVEQKQVAFYDETVTAVRLDSGQVLVPIRPICEQLGIDWHGQRQRIGRDPVLSNATMSVVVTHSNIDASSRRPRTTAMICLPLEYLNGWLFGISANRVKAGIRDRLIRYQTDCYKVLYEAMQDGRLTVNDDLGLSEASPDLREAYRLTTAVLRLIHNQVAIEAQQRRNVAQLADHAQRIEALETAVASPSKTISDGQAMEISQAVKAVAMIMSKQTKSNQYGAVYGELYRRFSVTSYKSLPASKFTAVMEWLNEWREQLESNTF